MKKLNLKWTAVVALAIILGTVFFTSCKKDAFVFPTEVSLSKKEKSQLIELKNNKPYVFAHISWDNFQRVDGLLSLPVIENDEVVSRLIVTNSSSFIVDYSNWQNELKLYDFKETKPFVEFDMVLNEREAVYEPVYTKKEKNSSKLNSCVASCAISGLYLGVSDGPLPFADIAALIWMGLCIQGCHDSYGGTTGTKQMMPFKYE
tara:strand:- start:120 stop:731 length:612 start_codon:yes stop_codon:yes gene_type:complete